MKVIIEIDKRLSENEILIKCYDNNDLVKELTKYIEENNDIKLDYYKNNQQYNLSLNMIIFFETNSNNICAHTISDTYFVKEKLYELETMLPKYFIRISKSTIININYIHSVTSSITSSNLIEFKHTYKKVYVSRFYYKNLKERLKEKN